MQFESWGFPERHERSKRQLDVPTDLGVQKVEATGTYLCVLDLELNLLQRLWDDFQVVHECKEAWADLPGGYPPTKY